MIFHENCLLADNSHEISYLIFFIPYFFRKLGRMSQNLSSAAVVIGALRANNQFNDNNILQTASLTHRAPPRICSRRHFQILMLSKNNK